MRIAMFSETFLPNTDGVVTRLCATLRHLSDMGHEVLLFAPQGAPSEYAGARVVGVPSFRFFLYPEKKFAQPWPGVWKTVSGFSPELIHAVNPGFLSFAALYYARRLRLPLLMSYHTHIPAYAKYYKLKVIEPFLWWSFRAVHNQADLNLCPSRATMAELEARGFRNLAVWERGVDLSRFSPRRRSERMRARLCGGRVASGDKVLLYVGRLAAEKGLERLRPALEQTPGVHLAIVGDGPHRAQLERAFADTQATFLGYLFGDELAEAYASADGFVFPSTTETLGLVLYEAMASGLPVMAADSPATREVLLHGSAGLIFNPQSPASVARTLQQLLYDEETRTSIRGRAAEVAGNLDWRRSAEQLAGYYAQLTAARRCDRRAGLSPLEP